MKKLPIFLMAALCACSKTEQPAPLNSTVSSQSKSAVHKRIILNKWSDNGLFISGKKFVYQPGDTLVLQGNWSYCSLDGFYGTASDYVVLINDGSQVQMTSGFSLTNCRYVKILGTGTADKYGFRISVPSNDGVGITITGRSSNIEVSNVDIYNKTYGYWVKQEANCIDSLQFPNWVLNDIRIHDGRVRKANQEAMYLGSTDPNGIRSILCNGLTIFPKPLRLSNIKVFNMIIDSTYRSGIQLSCADYGRNEIHDNVITNCGYEYVSNGQGSGISLGGYTTAYIYNNRISNTYTMGISSLGAGVVSIENNKVKNSGTLSGHTVKGMASIMIDTRNTNPVDSTQFFVKNNQLGNNTDVNVRIYKTYPTYAVGNIICNNGANVTVGVVSGINWKTCSQ